MTGIEPDWPAPHNIRTVFTIRSGGVSDAPYDTLNLATHVGDDSVRVEENRALLELPGSPRYLNQVHGNRCVYAEDVNGPVDADASFTDKPGTVLAIMVADCLPVLFSSRQGDVVGIAHAGWRGLANGVLLETIRSMKSESLVAWMGPAISACHYEVGEEVRELFESDKGFTKNDRQRWQMDLYEIARDQMSRLGVEVFGGGFCTFGDQDNFFSYRRDGVTGRMGGFIWIEESQV